ncbi:hypothetical protein Tco_0801433 [Tanacetum coccineum]|uniref:Uncharacterized protein n=1 Tax=Tanacetum coccineum TaxID=301880 RepID=A0ABQ4ZZX8_9ASTR
MVTRMHRCARTHRGQLRAKARLLHPFKKKHSVGHDKVRSSYSPHPDTFNKITSTMKFPMSRSYVGFIKFRRDGNFWDKISDAKIIESKSKVRNSRNKPVVAKVSSSTSTPEISSDVAELKDMVKALLLDKKNLSPAPT